MLLLQADNFIIRYITKLTKIIHRLYGYTYRFVSAPNEIRTHTSIAAQGILSPSCLPFHH